MFRASGGVHALFRHGGVEQVGHAGLDMIVRPVVLVHAVADAVRGRPGVESLLP